MPTTIPELTAEQLHQVATMDIGQAAILFTSPFCGTCKVALTMLQIVKEVGVPHRLFQANINFTPQYRELWKIRSIPALVILKNGEVTDTIYAMNSVDSLYAKLQSS